MRKLLDIGLAYFWFCLLTATWGHAQTCSETVSQVRYSTGSSWYSSLLEKTVYDPCWDQAENHRNSTQYLHTDTPYFTDIFNFQNRQSDKEIKILSNGNKWGDEIHVLFGMQARFSAFGAYTNRTDKFSYLTRFPTNFKGRHASDARLLHANAGVTGHIGNYIHIHSELLFSDVFSFPDFKQGSLQVRQAYAVFGDLDQTPWYAFLGKKNLNFGDMGTLSPFSQSVVWHYFGALHEAIGVGYEDGASNVTLSAINGGRGIRVADSKEKGDLNNFAANARYRLQYSEECLLQLGAGFLYGTIYDTSVAEHLDPNAFGEYNSAWDVNSLLQLGNLTLAGEFVSTLNDWPATGHPVVAYRTEAAYSSFISEIPTRYSVSWSEGRQGRSETQFEFNRQLVVGMGIKLNPNALFTLEYVRSFGFAPLINITTVSDKSVKQDSFVAGFTIVL